ncbi:zinc ABC transporter substrate-binding protein [Pseudooceanicola sp.]|uniref:zinc ABC transporter substrate-binding protein n=1 Tax=Pseudooceanicola sp. TaxID=1914328 RepID=UPI0026350FA1|nr:zinc ABC transporter substrate-binding protein [Pseudooceanicola sp.]MDF1855754.1 zinc ABC transporter substrate-binding protein [Pseudooceanicola sp.]
MSRNLAPLSLAASLLAGAAFADAPNVAVDITPVHSLVARVMEGVGEPSLIVASGASPHEYSLRPSEAGALQDADLVFWVGPDLTPWLHDAIETLANDATVVELIETDGTTELPSRENALLEAHDHGDEGHDADHEDEDHGDHAEEHADDDHAGHEGHDHGGHDPHAWLSLDNGAVWLNAIAAALSTADPDNAGTYYANAAAGRADLANLRTEINSILDPVRGGHFVVFHDAYQYFEVTFDFPASGAITVSDATDPSPARIAEIQARVADQNVTCIMAEPQFSPGIVAAIMDGTEAHTGVLDPLGSDLEPGPNLYPQLLRNLAKSLADCL